MELRRTRDEFEWRRRFAHRVASRMGSMETEGQRGALLRPAEVAKAARGDVEADWVATFGRAPFPFSFAEPVDGLPVAGGVRTADGDVWVTIAYAETTERSIFPKRDRIGPETLQSMARSYDPGFRKAAMTLPDGRRLGHDAAETNVVCAGWIQALSFDGVHLWAQLEPIVVDMMRHYRGMARSISLRTKLEDLDPPGPYLFHVAILPPGEQPGQPGHIPLEAFLENVQQAERGLGGAPSADVFRAAAHDLLIATQSQEEDVDVDIEKPTAEPEAEPNAGIERSAVADPKTPEAEPPAAKDTSRSALPTSDKTEDLLRAMEAQLRTLVATNLHLATRVDAIEQGQRQAEAQRADQEAIALGSRIREALQKAVDRGALPAGDLEAELANMVDKEGRALVPTRTAENIVAAYGRMVERSLPSRPYHRAPNGAQVESISALLMPTPGAGEEFPEEPLLRAQAIFDEICRAANDDPQAIARGLHERITRELTEALDAR